MVDDMTTRSKPLTIITMTPFVQIVVNVPAVTGVFDYSVPESLAGKVGVGHLVIVPFGKQTVQGVVLRFVDQPSVRDVKEIIELVDERVYKKGEASYIQFAFWLPKLETHVVTNFYFAKGKPEGKSGKRLMMFCRCVGLVPQDSRDNRSSFEDEELQVLV